MAAIVQRRLARMIAMIALFEADSVGHDPVGIITRYAYEGFDLAALTAEADEDAELVDERALKRGAPCGELFLGLESGMLNVEGKTFAVGLVRGVGEQQATLDHIIALSAAHWPMEQMARVDKTILRLAIYEIIFGDDVPIKAAINEAIELGKCFGSDSSGRFINGVLGSVVAQLDTYRGIRPQHTTDAEGEA